LTEGLSVIIGMTDSGKSAMIRAIRWVIENRPVGDSFRSHWGGTTKVTLVLDSGNIVIREKGTSSSKYYLNDQEFVGFGAGVPEEISKVLNINEINLQSQFEPHFLISRTPGEIAHTLNKIAHIDKIDSSLKNINSWGKVVDTQLKQVSESIEKCNQDLTAFDTLDSIEDLVVELELNELKEIQEEAKLPPLLESIRRLSEIDVTLLEFEDFEQQLHLINEILGIDDNIKQSENALEDLLTLIEEFEEVTEDEKYHKKLLTLMPAVSEVSLVSDAIVEETEQVIKLRMLLRGIESLDKTIKTEEGVCKIREEDLLEHSPETCPFCNQVITK
jgi:exonuclease SbcC